MGSREMGVRAEPVRTATAPAFCFNVFFAEGERHGNCDSGPAPIQGAQSARRWSSLHRAWGPRNYAHGLGKRYRTSQLVEKGLDPAAGHVRDRCRQREYDMLVFDRQKVLGLL